MGRKRKELIDRSTPIIFRIDNKTLFRICDMLDIKYDATAEVFEEDTKNKIIKEIKKIVEDFVK